MTSESIIITITPDRPNIRHTTIKPHMYKYTHILRMLI